MNPKTGPQVVEDKKPYPYRDSHSGPSALEPMASRCTDSRFIIIKIVFEESLTLIFVYILHTRVIKDEVPALILVDREV
jgi:hypothetical protein